MNHLRLRALEIIAFTSGFALMAFELVAARILAPYIGSSTYVWTSVIGVIIASLSLGYYAGGKLADKHHRHAEIAWLCLLAALAVVLVVMTYQPVLGWISGNIADPRLQGVVASLLLFAPTSFLIGVKAPYLAKLKVTSLERTGQSVASLSALNAVGGIVGVFAAGFILFSYIGSRETLAVITLLLVASSWLVVPRQRMGLRAVLSVSLLLAAATPVPTAGAIAVDTPSAHYEIVEGYTGNDTRKIRALLTGPSGAQSGVYVDGSDDLAFWYTRELAQVVSEAPKKQRILVLGGGTFTLPSYLAKQYPESTVDVVEIDPGLEKIAAEHFNYQPMPNLNLIFSDARSYVEATKQHYDIVIADVYSETSVPFSLMTREYGEAVGRILTPDGLLAANVIAAPEGPCRHVMDAISSAQGAALGYGAYKIDPRAVNPTKQSNIIMLHSNAAFAMDGYAPLGDIAAEPYTDNFMPAERLQYECRQHSRGY